MKKALVLFVLVAVPIQAEENGANSSFGTLRPALSATFNGGLSEHSWYNGAGFALGGHVSLAKFGRLRFPSLGAQGALLDKCPPTGSRSMTLAQAAGESICQSTFAAQLSGGAELILIQNRNSAGYMFHEMSFVAGVTRIVVGPLKGSYGAQFGLSFRYR